MSTTKSRTVKRLVALEELFPPETLERFKI